MKQEVEEEQVSEVEDASDEQLWPDQEASAARNPRRSKLAKMLGAGVSILLVAALVVSVVELASQHSKLSRLQADASLRSSALAAGSTYAVYLSSYNYADLNGPKASWTEIDQHSTASFRKDFDSTKSTLTSAVNQFKASATGTVVAAAVDSLSSSRATVLVFIDQKVTNTAVKPGTQHDAMRAVVVMARQNGKWLIDGLQVPT